MDIKISIYFVCVGVFLFINSFSIVIKKNMSQTTYRVKCVLGAYVLRKIIVHAKATEVAGQLRTLILIQNRSYRHHIGCGTSFEVSRQTPSSI